MEVNKSGVLVTSRQVVLDPPPDSEVPLTARNPGIPDSGSGEFSAALVTVIAMAVLEIVLPAGPAFAVGARRSRRQLGSSAPAAETGAMSGPWCSVAVWCSVAPARRRVSWSASDSPRLTSP
jgi:hypothetical protein